jgi:hypothetical protein
MGKWKTRDIHQRRMDQINNTIDTSIGYLRDFINIYAPQHPEMAKAAEGVCILLVMAEENIDILKRGF